jgi:hypothetical protein
MVKMIESTGSTSPDLPAGENEQGPEWASGAIGNNDVVTIPIGTSQNRADIMGGEVYARLKLGGHSDGKYEPQDIDMVHVNWKEDANYQALARRAEAAGRRPSNVILIAYKKGRGVTGTAFVPEEGVVTLGREGSLQWFDYGIDHPPVEGWTPFEDNSSISRRQLSIRPQGGKMVIVGLTGNSDTQVEAPWIKKEGQKP